MLWVAPTKSVAPCEDRSKVRCARKLLREHARQARKQKLRASANRADSVGRLLRMDCLDEESVLGEIKSLPENSGFLSGWDRRSLLPFSHQGLYELEKQISAMNQICRRVETTRLEELSPECGWGETPESPEVIEKAVQEALAIVENRLKTLVSQEEIQEAMTLCMQKAYSEDGCQNVIDGMVAVGEKRLQAVQKLRGQEVDASDDTVLASSRSRWQNCVFWGELLLSIGGSTLLCGVWD